MTDDTTIRRDQLRIRRLESMLLPAALPDDRMAANADTARAWLDRSLCIGTNEGVCLVADRLARGLLALDREARELRDQCARRDIQIAHLAEART